jgi:hypothetical protein
MPAGQVAIALAYGAQAESTTMNDECV